MTKAPMKTEKDTKDTVTPRKVQLTGSAVIEIEAMLARNMARKAVEAHRDNLQEN